jgi:hypothetical protein
VLRDDYLHRMIRQLSEFIARIAGFTATENWTQAIEESDRAWTDLLDVPRELVDRLDGPTLAKLLGEPAKMRCAAELLAAEARIHQGKRDPVHAMQCTKRAFELYLEARALDPQDADDIAIFELARLIPPNEIDPRYRS